MIKSLPRGRKGENADFLLQIYKSLIRPKLWIIVVFLFGQISNIRLKFGLLTKPSFKDDNGCF